MKNDAILNFHHESLLMTDYVPGVGVDNTSLEKRRTSFGVYMYTPFLLRCLLCPWAHVQVPRWSREEPE